jgi:hypothetical protein
VTTLRRTPIPRSWALPLGGLSVSGPLVVAAGNAPALIGAPLLPWVSILLDLWAVASVALGVAAIVVARDDLASPRDLRPRSAAVGLTFGVLGLVLSGCLFVLWLLTPLPF